MESGGECRHVHQERAATRSQRRYDNLGDKAGRIMARNNRMAQSSGKQAMLLEELAQPFFARFGDECAPRKVARRAAHRARVRLVDG